MLSKEEIEKAKKKLNTPKKYDLTEIIRIFKRNGIENYCIVENVTIQILLQYIDQLEEENNKQNKMIDEMAKAYMKVTSEKYRIKNICEKGKCQYEECHEDDWAECVKKYFEKKVEKENG